MVRALHTLARSLLERANLSLLRGDTYSRLVEDRHFRQKYELLREAWFPHELSVFELLDGSRSQIGQDLFALQSVNWERNGFFVEFGATDGCALSNTYLLETQFGWRGVLAEPAPVWRQALETSGRTADIDFDCVWSVTDDTLLFRQAALAELSTIERYASLDGRWRKSVGTKKVTTVSLVDLLHRHNAPFIVDYLSIDTEGSEYEILNAFDFRRYRFRCITCEHNFTHQREQIHALLSGHGYVRLRERYSMFDDWYVHSDDLREQHDRGR